MLNNTNSISRSYPILLLVLLMCCIRVTAQTFPKEGAELNYRIIGFSFPKINGAQSYTLEIAAGNHSSEESFNKKIIHSSNSMQNKMIAEVPEFASNYTWRIINVANNAALSKSNFYHFSTGAFGNPDSPSVRLQVLTPANKYADAYVFLNIPSAIFDMNGKPVWFLQRKDIPEFKNKPIRDLKITNNGTITFLVAGIDAYEVDYNCNVLWKTPNTGLISGDSCEHYNHELTKLNNGHYMVLGTELTWSDPNGPALSRAPKQMRTQNPPPIPIPVPAGEQDDRSINKTPKGPRLLNHRAVFGTILEYDKKGNLLWSWKSSSFFQKSDLEYYPNKLIRPMHDIHQNSFTFDEKNKVIYLSYKNIHRILKLKYPDGTVIRSYGETYVPGMQQSAVGSYCFQHSVKLSDNGDFYLFNNNSCHRECTPEIMVLREPAPNENYPSIVWNYEFPVAPLASAQGNISSQPHNGNGESTVGGNVIELPDRSMFASLCTPYSDLFIVSRDKQILWHATCEKWDPVENRWGVFPQYRASIITGRKELEQLIWNSQNTDQNQ